MHGTRGFTLIELVIVMAVAAILSALAIPSYSDYVLRSRASWEVLSEGYRQHCADPSFVNYFWTLRSMQSPLLMLAEASRNMTRARVLHSISTGYAGFSPFDNIKFNSHKI